MQGVVVGPLLASFFAALTFVFLKAFQQRNVAFDNYRLILPTSLCMAASEVYVVDAIASQGWSVLLVLAIGFGSGIGCVCAMYLHRRFFMKQQTIGAAE